MSSMRGKTISVTNANKLGVYLLDLIVTKML